MLKLTVTFHNRSTQTAHLHPPHNHLIKSENDILKTVDTKVLPNKQTDKQNLQQLHISFLWSKQKH